ncbi:hypothetical protein AX15_007771 [Amanita polypyramis BW_CC]|nr:hypothetical protein AX15_007771 [Amanita polypyramis BW_CC]
MSHIKAVSRPHKPSDSDSFKWRAQARQLQELFPTWSNDDIQSLLIEVAGDVEQAVTRITEGSAEQWAVTRKKDKKHTTASSHPQKESPPVRGDSRGGRGARGGRGGSGRGGTAGRGRGGSARGGAVNGHISRTGTPRPTSTAPHSDATPSGEQTEKPSASQDASTAPAPTDKPQDVNCWTDQTNTSAVGLSNLGTEPGGNESILQSHPPTMQTAKTPATSKLSWAQIARPQEKPVFTSHPPVPSSTSVPSASVLPAPPTSPPPDSEQPQQGGWEEPTTVEVPVWEDEPTKPSVSTPDGWMTAQETVSEEIVEHIPQDRLSPIDVEKVAPDVGPALSHAEEPLASKESESQPTVSIQPPVPTSAITATPSPKLAGRAAISHRMGARHKSTDQPVVMPNSFGTNIEKVGMQFGSLSLGGDSLFDNNPPEPEVSSSILETAAPSTPPAQVPLQQETSSPQAPAAAAAPPSSTSLNSVFQPQQPIPQQAQQQTPTTQTSTTHHPLPTSVSQPAQVQTPTHSVSAISQPPQNTSQHQPHTTNHHQHQHPSAIPQQAQQAHSLHHYSQHGLSAHHDSQPHTSLHQQPQSTNAHSTYFRQTDATTASTYFHAPTPPSSQSQDSYTSFTQLASQAQHQQAPHLGGFGPADYGYGDNQRVSPHHPATSTKSTNQQQSFYDTYNQQTGFGNRSVLGHDDLKGLPGSQQQPPSSSLPPSGGQASQQHASQGNQPQPGSTQAPQQYPPPVPYYYTHPYPQNQYYGSPYSSGYGVPQPFVKYPTMFQPGPPGPGSAPSPAGKQPGGNVGGVQPQNNPYSQGLYQPGSYEDYQQHHTTHQQQHHQHSHSLGLGQGVGVGGDYSKQLYGAGQGSMQGFMGLNQTGAGTGVPSSAGGPRGGGSPETAYKPYAPKDVGVGVGRGGVQQGQVQGQPQSQGQNQGGQGPQGQGFYGNRFSGGGVGGGVGVGGPQNTLHQQGPQAHLGYPQGAADGGFYSYPARQQYWQ